MDSTPFIDISQVSHTYAATRASAAHQALDQVSLGIRAGEKVALLGPNGSGKSTLLRILMTALKPSAGAVWIDGLDVGRQGHQVRARLGVVFQKPALDSKMTVRENLRAAGALYGIPRRAREERIDALIAHLGLGEWGETQVGALSGGLARRVELARALLPHPPVLLLDEPTTGLDPMARRDFWRQVEVLRAARQLTVVLTTHLLDEAQDCDRVAILHRGRLLAFDRPEQLQRGIGLEVLSIRGEGLEALGREIGEFMGVEGRIVDQALLLPLDRPVSLDALRQQFRGRITALSLAHPSLDDVFVQFTGERLVPAERP